MPVVVADELDADGSRVEDSSKRWATGRYGVPELRMDHTRYAFTTAMSEAGERARFMLDQAAARSVGCSRGGL